MSLPKAQEEQIQCLCSAQSSCKSNSIWAALHTEILDTHLMSIAPWMCLTDCAALGQQVLFIPHVMDSLCMCYIAAVHLVLLGATHPGQKQTSGHTGRCDGLSKERKHLGLSVKWPWTHSHLISTVFTKKDFVMSWRRSRLHQQTADTILSLNKTSCKILIF